MNGRTTIIIGIIILALGAVGVWMLSQYNGNNQTPSISPSPDNTSRPGTTSTPSNGNNQQTQIPDGWTRAYDATHQYAFTYPADYSIRPATNPTGESAVYSFDPAETPNRGGIPADELKIAVVFMGPNDPREITYDDAEIESEEEIQVDGYTATKRRVTGGVGGSISTEVSVGGGTYVISAYPPTSERLEVYDQFINSLDLDAEPPVEVTSVEVNETITSPVTVEGEVSGTWFSEGQLPVFLRAYDGEQLAQAAATSTESWMTTDTIPFSAQLQFQNPDTNSGFIVIEKDNPSGLPQNAYAFYIPVSFE